METSKLKEDLLEILSKEGRTIPELCKDTGIKDEYTIMSLIAELEDAGNIILNGFIKMYREDGGAIYLAKYSTKKAS